MSGKLLKVRCQLDWAGRSAFSEGSRPLTPGIRIVFFGEAGRVFDDVDVVGERGERVLRCKGVWGGCTVVDEVADSSRTSIPVAVADDAVSEAPPRGIWRVLDESCEGEAVTLATAASVAGIAISAVGPLPLYGSAWTM